MASTPTGSTACTRGHSRSTGATVDITDQPSRSRLLGITDNFARFTRNGQVGYGLFEVLVIGPHQPSGLL